MGDEIYELAVKLFPICRSITGNGVRKTLKILKEVCPQMNIFEVPTGTRAFDWTVPKEWNVFEAYIEDEQGNKIVDFEENNLHVMGYSIPVDRYMSRSELNEYLYSSETNPDAIPYVTSYYKERFGFCLAHNQRQSLQDGMYHVYIDSELKEGNLTYGEIILPGKTDKEVFLSTYICHPSMANNELSGPCIAIYLAKWLESLDRNYTYRIIFIPETIGSITYLSKNFEYMKEKVEIGFNITCVGDEGDFSYIQSRYGNNKADRVVKNIFKSNLKSYKTYSFLERGSDERQYLSPGIDLPMVCITRSKFGEYKEYHTSKDDLNFITAKGLNESLEMFKKIITIFEHNKYYRAKFPCEPQLGKYGLYPTVSYAGSAVAVRNMTNFLSYCDGTNDLFDISEIIGVPVDELIEIAERLKEKELIIEIGR